MLCPNCGTEVGEKATLCERCAANARSSLSGGSGGGSGGQIGAIRPALKVVRLKPGQAPPPEYYQQQQARKREPEAQPFSGQAYQQPSAPEPDPIPYERPRRGRNPAASILGAALILGAAWGTVWLVKGSGGEIFRTTGDDARQELEQDYSHIVIHEKKEVVIDGQKVVAKISLDDDVVGLSSMQARWTSSKNLLEVSYFGEVPLDSKLAKVQRDTKQPLVKALLQFAPLAGKLDRDKLQSYMLELFPGPESIRVVKTYSPHLSSFGEVTPMSGGLKGGEIARGGLRDTRTVERQGASVRVSWDLPLQAPLEVVK